MMGRIASLSAAAMMAVIAAQNSIPAACGEKPVASSRPRKFSQRQRRKRIRAGYKKAA